MKTPDPIQRSTLIPAELAGLRLDQALSQLFPDYSRMRLQTWIRAAQITRNGIPAKPRDKVHTGDAIEIHAVLETQEIHTPQAIPLTIVHEDASLLIINKPVGLVVHPAAGNWTGTLMNGLLHHCPTLATLPRAGIVHRLDKGTSGLLVIAKTLTAHTHLVKQLQQRTMHREYQAIVCGTLISGGQIESPIARHPRERTRMAVSSQGKPAVTHYRVITRYRAHTHIRVFLETGRTHQIRVHMSHIRHPLVGDTTYGGRLQLPPRITPHLTQTLREFSHPALHAYALGLKHPHTGESMEWTAPLPEDFLALIATLDENERIISS